MPDAAIAGPDHSRRVRRDAGQPPAAVPMTACLADVAGCAQCAASNWRGRHTCDDLCATAGQAKRDDPEIHRLAHTRPMCPIGCGTPLTDAYGRITVIRVACGYGRCVLVFCPGCRRDIGSDGPADCLCLTRAGHGTRAEFRRPGAGRWVKPSKRRRR